MLAFQPRIRNSPCSSIKIRRGRYVDTHQGSDFICIVHKGRYLTKFENCGTPFFTEGVVNDGSLMFLHTTFRFGPRPTGYGTRSNRQVTLIAAGVALADWSTLSSCRRSNAPGLSARCQLPSLNDCITNSHYKPKLSVSAEILGSAFDVRSTNPRKTWKKSK